MCFFFSLLPATFWLVIGYFVLFSATRAEAGAQTFGKVLAVWVFIIAAFIPTAGAYITMADLCPIERILEFERVN